MTESTSAAESKDEGEGKGKAEGKAPDEKPPGKLQQLIVEYGFIGLLVFLSISVLTYFGFVVAISAGWEAEGAGEEAGIWVAAYVGLQLTKPIRIPVVLVLTPIVAKLWHRLRGKTDESTPDSDEPGDDDA